MAHPDLFSPTQLGPLALPHRVVMAPLTRSRAQQPGDIPTALNAEYYRQRASAALIIAEATYVSPQGKGYAFTPGICTDAQIAGWQTVTDAVHAAGGRIYLQIGMLDACRILPYNPATPCLLRPLRFKLAKVRHLPSKGL